MSGAIWDDQSAGSKTPQENSGANVSVKIQGAVRRFLKEFSELLDEGLQPAEVKAFLGRSQKDFVNAPEEFRKLMGFANWYLTDFAPAIAEPSPGKKEYVDSLSHFVLRVRESAEKSVEQLARHAGLHESVIQDIENGKLRHLSPSVRQRLAGALNVEPTELLKREYSPKSTLERE